MSDLRTLPQSGSSSLMYPNGKLIYELTSAAALKDTDLFAISTSNNLTRNVSLKQIKSSINNDFYDRTEIDNLLDQLRKQINQLSDDVYDLSKEITNFEQSVNQTIQNLDNKIDRSVTELTNLINNTRSDLEEMIRTWIMYGTDIPSKLDTGRVYLQYF